MITREEIEAHRGRCAERVALVHAQGPWKTEPHRVEFIHAGLPCLLVRQEVLLHWCGYVGLPQAHPFFGHPPDDIPITDFGRSLSYASPCDPPVCHQAEPDADALWWVGFDCMLPGEYSPGAAVDRDVYRNMGLPLPEQYTGTYRDVQWVIGRTKKLAEQLARMQ